MLNKPNHNKKRRKRQQVDPDQLGLCFDKTPRQVTLLRSVDYRVTGLSSYAWCQVKELAIAIVYCGLKDGCQASRGALIIAANKNRAEDKKIIGSLTVFTRVLRKATDLGLVETAHASNYSGGINSQRWIDEEVLDLLVDETRELNQKNAVKPQGKEGKAPRPRGSVPATDPLVPYIATNSTIPTSSTENLRSTVDHKKAWTEEEIHTVRRHANEAVKKLGPTLVKQDRDLLCKACYLTFVSKRLSEHCFYDAIAGVEAMRPRKRYAYFQEVLADNARKFDCVLNRELAQLVVPEVLLNRPKSQKNAKPDRLCVEGDS